MMEKLPMPTSMNAVDIDNQHIEIINKLNVLLDTTLSNAIKCKHIVELGPMLLSHFTDEAKYMKNLGFPFIGTHLVEHSLLIARYNEVLDAALTDNVTQDIISELVLDTSSHIEHYDVLYADYYSAMEK